MDDTKRRAMIKAQAAKKKESGNVDPKVFLELVIGLMAEGVKTVTPVKHGADKGFMKAPTID